MPKNVCSFCGRSESEVKLLITGIKGYICENCAKQAYDIVLSSGVLNDKKNDKFALKQVPKPVEIKQYLDQYIIGQDGAKRSLAVAVYNHYKRLQQTVDDGGVEIEKSNIIMVGSTGRERHFWPVQSPNCWMCLSLLLMLRYLPRLVMWAKMWKVF